ncbi:MAG: cupredoxin family copper-binding protein [Paracoccaceae bacterium]
MKTFLTSLGLSLALAAAPALAKDHRVEISGMKFSPAAITVAPGDTITFANLDGAPHTATAKDGSFDTGRLASGQSAVVTITQSGTLAYFCAVHPAMKGKIVAK